VDLATFCGDRIVAAHDGIVLTAGRHYDRVMGWLGDLTPYYKRLDAKKLWGSLPIVVVIDDGNGYRSVYAHFGKVVVKEGQPVTAGTLLGYEGRTGRASGCHLHYGLFSPDEPSAFAMDPAVVKRMKVPTAEIARVDPLLVLPERPKPTPAQSPMASPSANPSSSASPASYRRR
jgi:Membrane proteins related to metalloendopeptidases